MFIHSLLLKSRQWLAHEVIHTFATNDSLVHDTMDRDTK